MDYLCFDTKKLACLLVVYGVYLLVGAAVFREFEKVNDKERMKGISNVKTYITETYNLSSLDFDILVDKVALAIKYRCKTDQESWCTERWDYYSSVYFAVSVVTTIGYGHLSPATNGGKIFCMVFAFFGIPLNLMILKLLGDRMTNGIQVSLRCIERRCCNEEVTKLKSKTMTIMICLLMLMLVLGGILYNLTESWTFLDGLYFCFVTFTTIGFGDLVPNEGKAPDNHYHAIIEVARATVVVLGLSALFAFVHLVLAYSEGVREFERETVQDSDSNENKSLINEN